MSLAQDLAGVGLSPEVAFRLGFTNRTLAGAGTAQSGATAITTNATLGTTAGGATAFLLPSTAELWTPYLFINTSATAALIYPPVGGAINGGSTDASISVSQNQILQIVRTSTNAWYADVASAGTFSTLTVSGTGTFGAIAGGDAALNVDGLATAQGGTVVVTGGTSSTSGNAGGAVSLIGGTPGATGVGGAAAVAGGIGGATSGAGGAASVTGGAGTNGNAIGGAASLVGGAGQGTAAGGAAAVTGGASGAGATGNGGTATIKGGASLATNGSGGDVVLDGGALAGTGMDGSTYQRGKQNFVPQPTPTAKTVTNAITAAQLATGIITTTGVTAPSIHQLPTGTLLKAEFPGIADNDAFDFSLINTGTGASDDATITVNTDVTIVGNPTAGALTDTTIISGSARFRARFVTGVTWVVYRLA